MERVNERVKKILGKQGGSYLPSAPGCYIDGSAGPADELDREIIAFAELYGYSLTPADRDLLQDTDSPDYYEYLTEIADSVVMWLNDRNQDEDVYWEVDDNSLFLRAAGDEE